MADGFRSLGQMSASISVEEATDQLAVKDKNKYWC
jgi:hypothetical protein